MNTNEQTLVIIKPDALERGLVSLVRKTLESEGLSVGKTGYVKFDLPLVRDFYRWLEVEKPQAIEAYICAGPMPIWIVEGEDAIVKTLAVKKRLRLEFCNSRLKNLLHCSESLTEFKWEFELLKRRNVIMKEEKTNNQVEVIVFKCTEFGETLFLMLKRNQRKGGFWQPVTGNVRPGESFENAARREVYEELDVKGITELIDTGYSFEFTENDVKMFERVFGVMIPEDQPITLSEEHTEFKWVSRKEALGVYLKYPGNKEGLKQLALKIQPSASEEGVRE